MTTENLNSQENLKIPRVSIGLPVCNGEKHLIETLNSILTQTYTNFELIISDNASEDQTQKICMNFAEKDQRIKYYRNDKNLGVAPNHNIVYKLAKGEYFRWAGDSDKIAPEFLQKCVDFLDRHLDVILCMPNTSVIGKAGEDLGGFDYMSGVNSPKAYNRFYNFLFKNCTGDYMYGLIRSDYIAKTSLNGDYPSSDLVFLAELSLYGKFDMIPEVLFFRRMNSRAPLPPGTIVNESYYRKVLSPRWCMFIGYSKAIWRCQINKQEKLLCYFYLAIWFLRVSRLMLHFMSMISKLLVKIGWRSIVSPKN